MIRLKQIKLNTILTLPSKELDKYEYLTGDDLEYKPRVVEQAKFEYDPLGKVLNKGLKKDHKKEGSLKRLANIKGTNEKQLQIIKDEHLKLLKIIKDEKFRVKSLRHQSNKEDK